MHSPQSMHCGPPAQAAAFRRSAAACLNMHTIYVVDHLKEDHPLILIAVGIRQFSAYLLI